MQNNHLYIDFEFSSSSKRWHSLICVAAIYPDGVLRSNQLMNPFGKQEFIQNLRTYCNAETTVVCYGVEAEVRSLFSALRVNTLKELPFQKYICLFREHRLLANRCTRTTWGKVIDKAGKERTRNYTGGGSTEERNDTHQYINLLNALYKFSGVYEPEHAAYKERYRGMCIRNHETEILRNLSGIIQYCEMDTKLLPQLHKDMRAELQKRYANNGLSWDEEVVAQQQLFRGWYGALCAQKTQAGYHVDLAALINLNAAKSTVLSEFAKNFNLKFPDYNVFEWNPKELRYKYTRSEVERYVVEQRPELIPKFPKTAKTQELSITKDHLGEMYEAIKYNLPEDDFLAQIYKYITLSLALRGCDIRPSPLPRPGTKGKAPTMGDYLDRNEKVIRPYYNDYGSQTSRSQPKANGYILAKPAWIRSTLVPPTGHWLVSADWNKQEPLYQGVIAGDDALIEAYASGDLCAEFGRQAGIIKGGEAKAIYDALRQACKQSVLGISYGMGPDALAVRITTALGRPVYRDEANRYISAWNRTYKAVFRWKGEMHRQYIRHKSLQLSDGWTMWGGNSNEKSIKNFPIQGGCATAMRYFEYFLWQRHNLTIPMTLHDGFYFYVPEKPVDGVPYPDYDHVIKVLDCMRDGFMAALGGKKGSDLVGVEMQFVHPLADKIPPTTLFQGCIRSSNYTIKGYSTKDICRAPAQ